MADFKKALTYVEPSLKREQSLNIEKLTWDDIGGLEDIKKVNNNILSKYICILLL